MTTTARPNSESGSHWYFTDGKPCYEIAKKDGTGMRATTLADARKLNLLPSVTTIMRVLAKPQLDLWKQEQACLAVLTTPRKDGEELDAFVYRVLHEERVQDEEMESARELGTDMHNGLEALFRGERITDELRPWIEPAYQHVKGLARTIEVESIVVGPGYAGKMDYLGDAGTHELVIDFKTTKKLPTKGSWSEHVLQLSAYANARKRVTPRVIKTANLYISTVDCGKFAYFENPPWETDYIGGFYPLVHHWQWSTGYVPTV